MTDPTLRERCKVLARLLYPLELHYPSDLCSRHAKAIEAFAKAERKAALLEAAEWCEANSKIVSGSIGPLMDAGFGMAMTMAEKELRDRAEQEGE